MIDKILELREQFKQELHNLRHDDDILVADRDMELILKAKIVAVGQVLDAIGYKESEE